jgi:hypothetical protein
VVQVQRKVGSDAYAQLRALMLRQHEMFVDQLYDLHRLLLRQKNMEAHCSESERYRAELQRLVSVR